MRSSPRPTLHARFPLQSRRRPHMAIRVIRTMRISSSRQLIEQRLRLLQVGGVESFGKPAIDWGDEVAGFGAPTLLASQPAEIADGAQFE